MIFQGYILSALYGALCLVLGLVAYKLGMNKKYTRKLVHILVGMEWVILYHFVGNTIHFFVVCLAFTALLIVSHLGHLMPMISSEGENSSGTVYYGVSMSVMALCTYFVKDLMLPFGAAVMITSFGDGFSGIFGQLITKKNPRICGNKTLYGTLAGLFASFLSLYIFSLVYSMPLQLWQMAFVAVLAVLLELITRNGLDNISVPLSSFLFIYAFLYYPPIMQYLCPILLTPAVIWLATEKKVLTRGGILCAVILDAIISVILGNLGFLALLLFLVLGVASDKIKHAGENQKSECRSYFQVFANAAPAAACAVCYAIHPHVAFLIGFLAAMGESLADTMASGIGARDKRVLDLFRMKKCEVGMSGGMSLLGTAAGALGAFLMMLLGYAFTGGIVLPFVLGGIAAFLGCIFDSLLGSLVQGKFRCAVCGALVEREEHCKKKTVRVRGFAFFDNDTVNFTSSLFAAILAIVLGFIFV